MINLERIVQHVETPVYVLNLDGIKKNIEKIRSSIAYPNFQIHYAMFCNDNEELLRFIKNQGFGILVLNENELKTALGLGFSKEQTHLTGGTFTKERLVKLLGYGIDINLDSLAQLGLAGQIAGSAEVGIRIKLYGKETKGAGEGILLQELEEAKKTAEKYNLKIIGLQTYIGTNILDEQKYLETAHTLANIASEFPDLRYINIGGGFGIPYSSKDKIFNWETFGRQLSTIFEQIRGNQNSKIQLKIEPGRSIVGDAGYFITKVLELREDNTLVVDAPYTNFARPFVYHTNHRVSCINKSGEQKQFKIRGCSINSTDYLSSPEFEGDPAILPETISEGDLLCFRDVGAYSPVMQMDFLSYPKAKTLVIN